MFMLFKDIPILMNVAALFSGGKDSVFTISIAQQYGWNVTHLVSLYPKKTDSWMFHSINIHLTKLLAEALELPLITKNTKGVKEQELEDLKEILQDLAIDGVVSGAIASEYQRTRIEHICHKLHIKSFTPLWHKHPELLLRDQVRAGFKIMIVGVFAYGFDQSWLGKLLTETVIEDLTTMRKQHRIHEAGEGGEFETLVLDGPLLQKRLVPDEVSIEWKRDKGVYTIKKAHLEESEC
jgi:ABC transporter with metal-binding/Fe-S-binding domain ATP-binding protein